MKMVYSGTCQSFEKKNQGKKIKENKPLPNAYTQSLLTLSIFPSTPLSGVSRDEIILFIVDVCPLSQNSALTGDQIIVLVPHARTFLKCYFALEMSKLHP